MLEASLKRPLAPGSWTTMKPLQAIVGVQAPTEEVKTMPKVKEL